jgi:hypothetical protein
MMHILKGCKVGYLENSNRSVLRIGGMRGSLGKVIGFRGRGFAVLPVQVEEEPWWHW